MLQIISRMGIRGLWAMALLAVASCNGSAPRDAPPPPMANADASSQSPALLGGPTSSAPAAAASAPALDAAPPVANPEDMSLAERGRVFGHRYHYTDSQRPHAVLSAMIMEPPPGQITPIAHPTPAVAPPPTAAPAPAARAGVRLAAPVAITAIKPFRLPRLDIEKWLKTIMTRAGAALRSEPGPALNLLTIPGMPDIDVPGLGKVPSPSVVVSALLVLAMMLLAVIARISNGRREARARRRKFRTMAGRTEVMLEPEMIDSPQAVGSAPVFKDAAESLKTPAKSALEDA